MQIYWIWLAEVPKLRLSEKLLLLERYTDAEDLYFATEEELRAIEGIRSDGMKELLRKDLSTAERVLEDCANLDIDILTWDDERYPFRLRNIPDPPLVLYYKGTLPDFSALPVISVVGTRKATPYGLRMARNISYQIARCGGLVVSGMAKGIDGLATEGALDGGGQAVGVLGCGVERVYPKENSWLFDRMEREGCLISEFVPGTLPAKWNFPRRNRIISGLSCGVLVVEAPEISGALITARQALDQGRDVFVVPGNADESACAGSNAMLRDGAMLASNGWDVMEVYEPLFPGVVKKCTEKAPLRERPALRVAQPVQNVRIAPPRDKKDIDNRDKQTYSDFVPDATPLTAEEKMVLDALPEGEALIDALLANVPMDAGEALAVLTLLQMKGKVMLLPGGRVTRRNK